MKSLLSYLRRKFSDNPPSSPARSHEIDPPSNSRRPSASYQRPKSQRPSTASNSRRPFTPQRRPKTQQVSSTDRPLFSRHRVPSPAHSTISHLNQPRKGDVDGSSDKGPSLVADPTLQKGKEAYPTSTKVKDSAPPPRPPSYPTPPEPSTFFYGDYNLPHSHNVPPPSLKKESVYLSPPDRVNYYSPSSRSDRTHRPEHWTNERNLYPSAVNQTASRAPSDHRSTFTPAYTNSGSQPYQYNALQHLEFRLLKIFPERKTMIKCEIIHASLENPPPYIAISYAWGDAKNTQMLELEGSLVPTTINLYGALEALRQKTDDVFVWADALCIDQQNSHERTQQVRLMTEIYSRAESVAIWLGPEEDDSDLAIALLRDLADQAGSPKQISNMISSKISERQLVSVVSLFERDYWRRLWIVQEVLNANSIMVYCGSIKASWEIFKLASQTFDRHRVELENFFSKGEKNKSRHNISPSLFSDWQVLVYQGPSSLPDHNSYTEPKAVSLLEVLRACRRKIALDPRDKLFGILGILPEEIRNEFEVDYSRSVKDVYSEIVDYLLNTTECLDVICDAIHFPLHTGSANLPSFVPDWSHIPQTAAIGHKHKFSAAGATKASCKFLDQRLNKLEISTVYLDTIKVHGTAVGTLCTLADYLMAFLNWRALLLESLENTRDDHSLWAQRAFCKTLSLGQVPPEYNKSNQWLTVCYHVFASLLRERLPHLPLDGKLQTYIDAKIGLKPESCRDFLQKYFGDQMMGRCFCQTKNGWFGMGTGSMERGDIVVVPLGCSTPIILRPGGSRGEYRFIGDVYIHGYMDGKAIDELNDFKREKRKYVLY